jgi:four helix bundle protein
MATIRDFKDLIAWQKTIRFAKIVYVLTRKFPKYEQFGGLASQVQAAAVSVSSNLAEGHARRGNHFLNFISIARGSLAEAESQLIVATELEYVSKTEINEAVALATEIRKMTAALAERIGSVPKP